MDSYSVYKHALLVLQEYKLKILWDAKDAYQDVKYALHKIVFNVSLD